MITERVGCFGCKFAIAEYKWTSDHKMFITCKKIAEWKGIPEKDTCEHSEKIDWSSKGTAQ